MRNTICVCESLCKNHSHIKIIQHMVCICKKYNNRRSKVFEYHRIKFCMFQIHKIEHVKKFIRRTTG